MKGMKFMHELYVGDVRELCIEKGYYTRGTNEQYSIMLLSCSGDMTENLLTMIAKDIKEHSDTEDTLVDIFASLTNLIKVIPRFEVEFED